MKMCPHCGWTFDPADYIRLEPDAHERVPTHDFPRPGRAICPGTHRYPWGPTDPRPLGKDGSVFPDPDLEEE